MLISIASMIFSFGLLVFFHELGHFITAKSVGMRVDEFALGFGPKLVAIRRDETLYSLRAIPLGGFNKIAGMDPDEKQDEQSFNAKPIWARISVFFAGSAMNFVLAIILFTLVVFIGGKNTILPVFGHVLPDKPAEQAGLMAGDHIIAIDGVKVEDWQQLVQIIQTNSNKSMIVEFERNGNIAKANVTPEYDENSKRGIIGIYPSAQHTKQYHPGFGEAMYLGATQSWETLSMIGSGIMQMLTGNISADVAGPIGIAKMTGEVARVGFLPLLCLTAMLSLNIGLLNLLPVPVLDGGHIVMLFFQGLRGKPFGPKFIQYTQYVGLALLISLFVVAMYNDVLKLSDTLRLGR